MASPYDLLVPGARAAGALSNRQDDQQRRQSFQRLPGAQLPRPPKPLGGNAYNALQPRPPQQEMLPPPSAAQAPPQPAGPVDERSLTRQAGDLALDGAVGLGNIIDVPGSVVRDVLTWLPGGPAPHNPLDQLLPWNWGASDVRISGEQFLEDYGLLDDSGEPQGLGTTLGRMGAGVAFEIATDPLSYFSFGGTAAVKGAGKGAQAARSLKKLGLLDDIDIYAKGAGKVTEAGGEIGKREALTKMTASEVLNNPMNRSGEDASKVTQKLNEAFEGALMKDKSFVRDMERAGVKPGTAEFGKMLDDVANTNLADSYARWRLPFGIIDKAVPSSGRSMDKFARGMRYSAPVMATVSKMSKAFEGKNTAEMQKAVRESSRVLQQDFVVAREEMFDNIVGIEERLSNFDDLSPEAANARRNEVGNYMREYLEDVFPVSGKRKRIVTTDDNGVDQVEELFVESREELFELPREDYASEFMARLRGVTDEAGNAINPDVVSRVESAIPFLDNMKDQMDSLVGKAADMKIDMTQLIDTEATYFPRLRQTSKGVITGRFGAKLRNLEPDNPFAIRRKDYLRDLPGGTAVLNRMSTDRRFAGRGSRFAKNSNKIDANERRAMKADFDQAYPQAAALSEESSDEIFDMIVSLPKEDVDKGVAMYNVNPAESALKALESAYSARSQADILRSVLKDNIYVKPRNLRTLEREIKAAGKGKQSSAQAADLAAGVTGQVAKGTDNAVNDVAGNVRVERDIPPPAGDRAKPKSQVDPDGGGSTDPPTSTGDPPAPKSSGSLDPTEGNEFSGYTQKGAFGEDGYFETTGTPARAEVTSDGVTSIEDIELYNPDDKSISVAIKNKKGEVTGYTDYTDDMYTVVSKPVDDATEAVQDSLSQAEYDKFVADGTVPDGVLDNIATKMADGEDLSLREVAVRNDNADEVQAILLAKKEAAEASQTGSKKTSARAKKPTMKSDGWEIKSTSGADGKKKPFTIYTHPDGWEMKVIEGAKRPTYIRKIEGKKGGPPKAAKADGATKVADSATKVADDVASKGLDDATEAKLRAINEKVQEIDAEFDEFEEKYVNDGIFDDNLPGGKEAFARYEKLSVERERLLEEFDRLEEAASEIDNAATKAEAKTPQDQLREVNDEIEAIEDQYLDDDGNFDISLEGSEEAYAKYEKLVAEHNRLAGEIDNADVNPASNVIDTTDPATYSSMADGFRAEGQRLQNALKEVDAEIEDLESRSPDPAKIVEVEDLARYEELLEEQERLAADSARMYRKAEELDRMDAEQALAEAFSSYTKPHEDYEGFFHHTGSPVQAKVADDSGNTTIRTVQQYEPDTGTIRVGDNNTPDDFLDDYNAGEYEILPRGKKPTGPGAKAAKAADQADDVEDVVGDITPEAAEDLARIERANADAIELGYTAEQLSTLKGEEIEYIARNKFTADDLRKRWKSSKSPKSFNAYLPTLIRKLRRGGSADPIDTSDAQGIFARLENVSKEDLVKDKRSGGQFTKTELNSLAKGLGLKNAQGTKREPLAGKIYDAVQAQGKASKGAKSKADRSKLPFQTTERKVTDDQIISNEDLVASTVITKGEVTRDALEQTGHYVGEGRSKFVVKLNNVEMQEIGELLGKRTGQANKSLAGDIAKTLRRATGREARESGFRSADGIDDLRFTDDQREIVVPAEIVDLVRATHPHLLSRQQLKFYTAPGELGGGRQATLVAKVGEETVATIAAIETKNAVTRAVETVRAAGKTDEAAKQAVKDAVKATPKSKDYAKKARQNLVDQIQAVRNLDETHTVMAIYDAVARTWAEKTGKDIGLYYDRLTVKFSDSLDAPKASGKATAGRISYLTDSSELPAFLIQLTKTSDRSTLIHEMSHMFRLTMREADPELADRLERVLGTMLKNNELYRKDGSLSVKAEEAFARGFERFLREGKAPTKDLRQVYELFASWLKKVYSNLANSPLKKKLPEELKQIYRELQGAPALKKSSTKAKATTKKATSKGDSGGLGLGKAPAGKGKASGKKPAVNTGKFLDDPAIDAGAHVDSAADTLAGKFYHADATTKPAPVTAKQFAGRMGGRMVREFLLGLQRHDTVTDARVILKLGSNAAGKQLRKVVKDQLEKDVKEWGGTKASKVQDVIGNYLESFKGKTTSPSETAAYKTTVKDSEIIFKVPKSSGGPYVSVDKSLHDLVLQHHPTAKPEHVVGKGSLSDSVVYRDKNNDIVGIVAPKVLDNNLRLEGLDDFRPSAAIGLEQGPYALDGKLVFNKGSQTIKAVAKGEKDVQIRIEKTSKGKYNISVLGDFTKAKPGKLTAVKKRERDLLRDVNAAQAKVFINRFVESIQTTGEEGFPRFSESAESLSQMSTAGNVRSLYQTTNLRTSSTKLQRYGLPKLSGKKKHKTRDVAAALQTYYRKRFKGAPIAKDDFTTKSSRRIADWMIAEVEFASDLADGSPLKSAVGWYSKKFPRALDNLGEVFPELVDEGAFAPEALQLSSQPGLEVLGNTQNARNLMTAITAVLSDGTSVLNNFNEAGLVYDSFRQTGFIDDTIKLSGQSNKNKKKKLQVIQRLIEEFGPVEMHEALLKEVPISELKEMVKSTGEKVASGYKVATIMPASTAYFGPKLGIFYANLMGKDGYLTMDRWWSRTFNRYRGTLIPKVGRENMDEFKSMLSKRKVINKPASKISDDEAIAEAAVFAKKNKDAGYQSKIPKAERDKLLSKANGINKTINEATLDQPYNGSDRNFMLETTERAQASLKRKGFNLSVADIQAILWYYEKELYGELGARPTQAISYEEITKQTAAHVHAARNSAGRSLDSVDGATGGSGYLNRIDDPETPGSTNVRSLDQTADINPDDAESLSYFSDGSKASVASEAEGKGTTKLIMMDPNDFLRMAEKLTREDVSRSAAIAARMDEGKSLGDIPFLMMKNNGDGIAEVTGHEGRHRALVFAKRGLKLPVRLRAVNGKVIRWNMQDIPDSFDRVEGVWPQRLVTQNPGSGDAIPFPVSDPLDRARSLDQTASGPSIERNIFDESDPKKVAARVSMPTEEWATSPQKTILTAFDGTTGEDFAEAISDLFIAEHRRMSPEMSKLAESTYRLVDGDWDTVVTRGTSKKTAREWMAEDFRKWSAGEIKAPENAEGFFAELKDYTGKLFAKYGRNKTEDMAPELGRFFDTLLGDSITGDMTSLKTILDNKHGVNYANSPRKQIEQQSLLAMLPPETRRVAYENALVDNHNRAYNEYNSLAAKEGEIEKIEEQIGVLEEKLANLGEEPPKTVVKELERLKAKIEPPPEDFDDWYEAFRNEDSPGARFMGVSLSVSEDRILGQVSVPKHLAEDIVTTNQGVQFLQDDKTMGGLWRWYDSYNALFKTNVTSTNPGFHVRNFFSGFIQNALNDIHDPRFSVLDPKMRRFNQPYVDMRQLMRGKTIEGISDIPIFSKNKDGTPATDAQATEMFAQFLFNYKIIDNPGSARDLPGVGKGSVASQLIGPQFGQHKKLIGLSLPIDTFRPDKLYNNDTFVGSRSRQAPVRAADASEMSLRENATRKVRDWYKRTTTIAQNIGDVVEIQHRGGGMLALLRQGYSPDEAARIVRLVQVDYSNLSTFEREYLRRIFPFYSFSRGMAVYLTDELMRHPAGKVSQTMRVQRNATDKDVSTPTYISKGLSIPLGSNADGTQHYLTNIGLMHEQPAQQIGPLFTGDFSSLAFNVLGNMNPLLKLPFESAYDESSFQQGVSGGVDLDDADPPLGRAISNVAQTVGLRDKDRKEPVRLGKLTELAVGSSPLSRYINTARTVADPRKGIISRGVNSLTGLRVSTVSPARQDAVLRERAEQYLQGVGARQFQKSYIPDEVKANMSAEELQAVQQYEQLIELLAKRSKERRKNKEKEPK